MPLTDHLPLNLSLDFENELNEAQRLAVTCDSGPVLVIAGAGSGKTRAIVYRVAWLVTRGVKPSSILLLTFTRKAAEEMLRRAGQLLGMTLSKASGGTFHSVSAMLLRLYGSRAGINPDYSIMDQGDSLEALDWARKHVVDADRRKAFPKIRTIAELISRATGMDISVAEATAIRYPHLKSFSPQMDRIKDLYEARKRENNSLDYDDLLAFTVHLLSSDAGLRDEISARWSHVLVDEYQDTNRLQAKLLELISSRAQSVMAVGDDSQSIYSFRGAEVANIMKFPDIFPGAQIIKLEENYRSTGAILAVTNGIIEGATIGYRKTLFTRGRVGSRPILAQTPTERSQSQFVVECVQELLGDHVSLREIAVLFRAGFHSFDLEGELGRASIPFVKFGGMKLVESAHIKDVLAHLKVLANPADRLSWERILRILPGVGPKTAGKSAEKLAEQGLEAMPKILTPRVRKKGAAFGSLLSLFQELQSKDDSIPDKIDRVKRYYEPHLMETYDNYPKRLKELNSLADLAVQYESLKSFLSDLALDPPAGADPDSVDPLDSLVLSTIHSAKGLEWHTVIVIWACEGRIPSPMALSNPEELEEERRLVYVAATRAKRRLVFASPRAIFDRVRGRVPVRITRFLQDLPHERFRRLQIP